MTTIVFSNDGNAELIVNNSNKSHELASRTNSEIIFRYIVNIFIERGIITGNILDSGAWVGDNALPWSLQLNGKVFAIDPDPENCQFINDIAQLNNLSSLNIETLQYALANFNRNLYTNDTGDQKTFNGSNGNIVINAVSIDYLNECNKIPNISFTHLDVEGMEKEVIEGAINLINSNKPIITFEQHIFSEDYMGVCMMLKEKGYSTYIIEECFPGCREDCRNILALPIHKKEEALRVIQENKLTNKLISV